MLVSSKFGDLFQFENKFFGWSTHLLMCLGSQFCTVFIKIIFLCMFVSETTSLVMLHLDSPVSFVMLCLNT